jgi:DNA polymerase III epsilon subunit-like protein
MDSNVCRFHLDGEMLGGIPGHHPLVEIGCCTVDEAEDMKTFSVLIRPYDAPYEFGAKEVLRRPYQEYCDQGIDPRDAAHQFIRFLKTTASGRVIELSYVNPGFDVGFLKLFLHQYADDEVGVIGYKSYDVVSYACGVFQKPLGSMSTKKAWEKIRTLRPEIYSQFFQGEGNHSALADAIAQTRLLLALEACIV